MVCYKASIHIVEDDANLVFLLKTYLESLNITVSYSYTGSKGLENALSNKHDLLIVDLGLPDIDGLEIIRKYRECNEKPILVITGSSGEEKEISAYELGINIFHRKPINYELLRVQVESLIKQFHRRNILCIKDIYMDLDRYMFFIKRERIDLTKTEFLFLKMLIESQGEVYTRDRIMKNIMDCRKDSGLNCVDTMVSRIRKKISVNKYGCVIKTVNKTGYSLGDRYISKLN